MEKAQLAGDSLSDPSGHSGGSNSQEQLNGFNKHPANGHGRYHKHVGQLPWVQLPQPREEDEWFAEDQMGNEWLDFFLGAWI